MDRSRFSTALDTLAIGLFCVILLVFMMDGMHLAVGPLRLSIANPIRPTVALVLLAALRLAISREPLLASVPHGARKLAWAIPHLAVTVLFLAGIGSAHRPREGFTSLIKFGDRFADRALPEVQAMPHAVEPGGGYDGQFYAQIALDPLLRTAEIRNAVDSLSYRARRILFPWFAYLLGWGQPARILQAYALLNVGAWLMAAVLMLRWLPVGSVQTTVAWLGCLLSVGFMWSVYESLTDGPSVLLLALAVVAIEQNRRWIAAAILGISGLGRETNLLGGVLMWPRRSDLSPRQVVRLLFQGAMVVAPLLLWMVYLTTRWLSVTYVGEENTAFMFTGYLGKWQSIVRSLGTDDWREATKTALVLVGATTQVVALACWYRDGGRAWWRLGAAYALFMLLLGPSAWEGFPGAFPRIVLPATFAFNVLLPGRRRFWPIWCLGNAGLVITLPELVLRSGAL